MLNKRASGLLLHPTCLPSPYGIGDLGPSTFKWLELLATYKQHYWQVLPLNYLSNDLSPYSAASSFAKNIFLISPDLLLEDGLLEEKDLKHPALRDDRLEEKAQTWKAHLLRHAYHHYQNGKADHLTRDFLTFKKSTPWLHDFSLFIALHNHFHCATWHSWPKAVRERDPQVLVEWSEQLGEQINEQSFLQFLFYRQWQAVLSKAHSLDIQIIGDLGYYPAQESADVWLNQLYFHLDKHGYPAQVGGAPPDEFSDDGQYWSCPTFRWDQLAKDGYSWTIDRIQAALSATDLLRLDHFIGYSHYFSIPAKHTPATGKWLPGPDQALFTALEERLPGPIRKLIAEDLGTPSTATDRLLKQLKIPNMKILQFGFFDTKPNPHHPSRIPRNSVAYSGTHDNDTLLGWYLKQSSDVRAHLRQTARQEKVQEDSPERDAIALLFKCRANTVIIPLVDLIGADSKARFNTPDNRKNSWRWRFTWEQIKEKDWRYLASLTLKSDRA